MIKKYGGLFFTNNALEDFVQRAKIQVNNKCNSSSTLLRGGVAQRRRGVKVYVNKF